MLSLKIIVQKKDAWRANQTVGQSGWTNPDTDSDHSSTRWADQGIHDAMQSDCDHKPSSTLINLKLVQDETSHEADPAETRRQAANSEFAFFKREWIDSQV